MHDTLEVNTNVLGVKGLCRIELYDAKTGELLESQEGYNFVSPFFANQIFKQVQKFIFGSGIPNGGIELPGNTNTLDGMLRYLVLTDSTMTESPTTEANIPGNVIGWSNRVSYAGGSAVEGSCNIVESFGSESLLHWVFDFPTNCANGTINSICWAYAYPETLTNYNIVGKATASNWTWIGKCARTYVWVIAGDGYYWGYQYSGTVYTLYKIDPTSFQEIASYVLPNPPWANRGVVSGGYFYYVGQSGTGQIYKLNLSTMTYVTSTTGLGYNAGYVYSVHCTDGTYLFLSCQTANSYNCARIRMSDLTLMETKVFTTYLNTLFYVGGVLYAMSGVSSTTGGTYTVNWTAGTVTVANTFSGEYMSAFSDGTNTFTFYTISQWATAGSGQSLTYIATIAGPPTNIKNYNLMARKLLGSPIVKTSAKTMKIIYEFTLS